MKIRIKGNSIRIRLSRTEVDTLAATGHLEEKTEFGSSAFTYVLQSKPGITDLQAAFDGSAITMYIPAHLPAPWVTNDTVGYSHDHPIGDGRHLFLLLEKDFKCIDNTTEDQSDNYEHPTNEC